MVCIVLIRSFTHNSYGNESDIQRRSHTNKAYHRGPEYTVCSAKTEMKSVVYCVPSMQVSDLRLVRRGIRSIPPAKFNRYWSFLSFLNFPIQLDF